MATPLVPVSIRCTYRDPDLDLASNGRVVAKVIGRSRVPVSATVISGGSSWALVNGALPNTARLAASPTGTVYYQIIETIEGHVRSYTIAVTAADAAAGIDLSQWQDSNLQNPPPTVVIPGVKGDPGAPGTGAVLTEAAATAYTAAVGAAALQSKTTRFNTSSGSVSQPLPAATANGPLVAVGWDATTSPNTLTLIAASRTDSNAATTSGNPVVTDASITSADQGRLVTGAGIPAGSYVGTVIAATSFRLSSSPSSQVDVNATATATGVAVTISDTIGAGASTSFAVPMVEDVVTLQSVAGRWRRISNGFSQRGLDRRYAALFQPGPKLHTDYRVLPDGPLPAAGDEGVPIVNPRNSSATPYPATVSGGRAVSNIPSNVAGASYIDQDLGAKVTRIGALFAFTAGGTDGSFTMAAWDTHLPDPVSVSSINTHIHFVIQPTSWSYGLFDAGTFVQIASGIFAAALPQDGTLLRAEARIDGSTATLVLPDNSTATVTDSRIGSLVGRVACWEFFKFTTGSCLQTIAATWADGSPDAMGTASPAGVARLVNAMIPNVAAAKWAPNPAQQVSPPSSFAPVNSALTVIQRAGPTGSILVTMQARLVVGVAANGYIIWGVGVGVGANVTPGGPSEALEIRGAGGTAESRMVIIEHLRTGLTPGQVYTVNWQHFSPSPDAGNYLDVNPPFGRFATITAVPA